MKRYSILAAALVLTLTVFTGCGCRRRVPETVPPVKETIMPTGAPTVAPTVAETLPAVTDIVPNVTDSTETVPHGTDTDGSMNNDATDTTGATNESRSRGRTVG